MRGPGGRWPVPSVPTYLAVEQGCWDGDGDGTGRPWGPGRVGDGRDGKFGRTGRPSNPAVEASGRTVTGW